MRKTTICLCALLLAPSLAAAKPKKKKKPKPKPPVEEEEDVKREVELEIDVSGEGEGEPPEAETTAAPTPAPEPVAAAAPTGIAGPGAYGVGGASTLAGLAGMHGRYQVNDDLGVQAVLAARLATVDGGTDYALGAHLHYRIATWSDGAIAVVGGVDVATGAPATPVMADVTTIALAAGLAGEWFVAPSLSLHGQLGVALGLGTGDPGYSGTSIQVGGHDLARFGFTYWLK
jgi:hypothetical protein